MAAVPEGDTIRRLAERIDGRFAGQRIERCVTRDPRLVGLDLAGRVLLGAEAAGKHLLVRFDDGRTLHAHLGMDGSFVLGPAARGSTWHRRIELWLAGGRLTGVDVPVLGVVATADEEQVVGHLGPDLCAPDRPDLDDVVSRLVRAADVPLAAALLDQRNVAGFGNVFAVELPFLVGVDPHQPVGTITGLPELVGLGAALIRWSTASGQRNTTGRRLSRSEHHVYGKRGRPCPICATGLAGHGEGESPWQRLSVWCPTCQPAAPERAVDVERARRLLALHPARRDPSFPLAPARRTAKWGGQRPGSGTRAAQ